ncbi:MAG: glycosyltransferase family 4 protein [Planctomycetes bacterium]|nr:glycosyltransferase family 4 protein [Planctomycetota bacterium]
MRILHLFSNWKWTGPAEPALNLAAELRRAGHDVLFACGRPVKGCENFVAREARARGIEPILQFRLNKHRRPLDNLHDQRRLPKFIEREQIDIVHAHLDNDHLLAARAVRSLSRAVPVVRTYYGGEPPSRRSITRKLLEGSSDAIIVISDRVRDALVAELGVPVGTLFRLEGTVDLARFDPARRVKSIRERLDVAGDAPCFGIVARMQRHRRFDLLLDTISRVVAREPRARFVFVGRGTRMEEVLRKPARERSIEAFLRFPGYLEGDEFVAALASMDALLFTVPGSDGSCRAVREAMAMGLPIVASKRGILPELVKDDETGFSLDEEPGAWASAVLRLASDRALRSRISQGARRHAARFAIADHAREVARIYRFLSRRVASRARLGSTESGVAAVNWKRRSRV